MKVYYKLLLPSFFALFMWICTGILICRLFDKSAVHTSASILLISGCAAFMGSVAFLYSKMVWMRLTGIPVWETADRELILRDVAKRQRSIRYKKIIDVRYYDNGIVVSYLDDEKRRKRTMNFSLMRIDDSTAREFISLIESRKQQ